MFDFILFQPLVVHCIRESAHIIREYEAFCHERLEEFNFLECPPDMKWTVNQMMWFLNKARVLVD